MDDQDDIVKRLRTEAAEEIAACERADTLGPGSAPDLRAIDEAIEFLRSRVAWFGALTGLVNYGKGARDEAEQLLIAVEKIRAKYAALT